MRSRRLILCLIILTLLATLSLVALVVAVLATLNPKQPHPSRPHDWYWAAWTFSDSRKLVPPDTLEIKLSIFTEPNIPITELHGKLVFMKNGQTIWQTRVAETPGTSFIDRCDLLLKMPYDDLNAAHRIMRFDHPLDLTPVFTVSRVVYADGTERNFE